ncbi:hypothetical protein Tco_0618087 [Tanacetum coccineum]
MFTDCTTKVDSEPSNGSNEDITNPYECDQTLNVSAGTLNLSIVQASLFNDRWHLQITLQAPFLKEKEGLVQNPVSLTPYVPPSKKDYEILFQLLFDVYFNPPPHAVSPDLVAVAAPRAVDPADSPSSTTIDQDVHLLVLYQQIRKFNLKSLIKLKKNHPLENVIGDPSRPVSTRSQLQEHVVWCYFDANFNPIPFGGKPSG